MFASHETNLPLAANYSPLRTATPTFVILFVVCFLFVDHREKLRGIYPSFLWLGKRVFLLGGE